MRFKKVAVGGSFDVLHIGHEALLGRAFEAGEFILIGLTSNEMLEKDVVPFDDRRKALEGFLEDVGEYEIIKLTDPLGPAASEAEIEAIVVSKETAKGASEINKVRKEKGLKSLEIISIPLILADDGGPISSTRVKTREIDRNGRSL